MKQLLLILTILLFFISITLCDCNSFIKGDLNNDSSIDIIDIMLMVDYTINDLYFDISDLNEDQIVNIFDIIMIVERIIYPFEQDVSISMIDFDFSTILINWNKSNNYGFKSYNLYYSNFIDNQNLLLYSTENQNDTSIVLNNIILNEQNYFWLIIDDFTGCELTSEQYNYELPFKSYNLDNEGNILSTQLLADDFKPSTDCMNCHEDHYNEWFSSMHSYTSRSPLFFSYKNDVNNEHPIVGENFCMQCHNPVAFLTGENTAVFDNVSDFLNSDLNQSIKDGIGCDVCHSVTGLSQTVHAGNNLAATAQYKLYPLGNIKFGSIQNPEPNPYHASYYLPTYSSSQMCLPCHDLVVRDVEAEITFTEWNRIPGFSMFGGVSCQDCHMPEKDNGYHDHRFVGVDIDLNIPINENPLYESVQDLLSTAAEIEFDVLNDTIPSIMSSGETLQIPLTIESKTAHSIPSGTSFNRQVWIELVINHNNQIIFQSGKVLPNQQLDFNDSNLIQFKTEILDENGNVVNNVTKTHDINSTALLAYQSRYVYYDFIIPEELIGDIDITARMLFRSFDPDFIMEHHPEFIDNLGFYEIDSISRSITIQ